MEKKKWMSLLQIIGVAGFILGMFQMATGFFISFLCTGLFFILDNTNNLKSLGMATGILAFAYSFYPLTL
ncbi:hypothetical protein [Rossellomorea vietnamensis]|uniref:hypothetical protein n=1 Tax=Rossellomorea vietnamensis TaxID=218284 RepID=UPI001E31F1DF|nr:hypothetical protein [Rossellomorea vietnamensis]MCC5803580.1 hypothetical protein [Rossellomorea vietnamensis]